MPPEYTTSGGYGSPLRRAPFNGPPRSGRHQPLLSISPTVFVHITSLYAIPIFVDSVLFRLFSCLRCRDMSRHRGAVKDRLIFLT